MTRTGREYHGGEAPGRIAGLRTGGEAVARTEDRPGSLEAQERAGPLRAGSSQIAWEFPQLLGATRQGCTLPGVPRG